MRNNTDPIPVFLFGDSAYPLLPWIMMEFSKGINIQEKSCSVVNFLMYVWQLRIHLVHETHFRCLQLAKDININILPRVLYSCSHIYFELQKEKKSRTEPCVSCKLWETSKACDKQFIIQKNFEWKESQRYS